MHFHAFSVHYRVFFLHSSYISKCSSYISPQLTIRWNDHKDHTGGSSEIKLEGEIGAVFCSTSDWEEVGRMDAGHDIDKARVLHHMMGHGGS